MCTIVCFSMCTSVCVCACTSVFVRTSISVCMCKLLCVCVRTSVFVSTSLCVCVQTIVCVLRTSIQSWEFVSLWLIDIISNPSENSRRHFLFGKVISCFPCMYSIQFMAYTKRCYTLQHRMTSKIANSCIGQVVEEKLSAMDTPIL